MSRWRVPLITALAWLAVVTVGSAAVWWVVSSVGEDLGPGSSVTAVVPGAGAGPGSATPGGPQSPSASPSPSSSRSSGAPAVATRQQSWSGRGGYVTVRCRGARAGLVAAQPDPGYAVRVGDRGPQRVEVSFEGRTEDGGRRVVVAADCPAGRPSFQASTGGGGDE